jgi:hypothetical protein
VATLPVLKERRIVRQALQELANFAAGRLAKDERSPPITRRNPHALLAHRDTHVGVRFCRAVSLLNSSGARGACGAEPNGELTAQEHRGDKDPLASRNLHRFQFTPERDRGGIPKMQGLDFRDKGLPRAVAKTLLVLFRRKDWIE